MRLKSIAGERARGHANHRRSGSHHRLPKSGERNAQHNARRPLREAAVDRGSLPEGLDVLHAAAGGADRRTSERDTRAHGGEGEEAVGRGVRVASGAC